MPSPLSKVFCVLRVQNVLKDNFIIIITINIINNKNIELNLFALWKGTRIQTFTSTFCIVMFVVEQNNNNNNNKIIIIIIIVTLTIIIVILIIIIVTLITILVTLIIIKVVMCHLHSANKCHYIQTHICIHMYKF